MKKLILSFALLLISFLAQAQTPKAIPNGDFEQWDSTIFTDLDSAWITNNAVNLADFGIEGISKVPGKSGSAVHLQEFVIGHDTIVSQMGIFVPGTQKATGITGYYRSNMVGSDKATFEIDCIKGGLYISQTIYYFQSVTDTFTPFNIPFNFTDTPDSIVIGANSNYVLPIIGPIFGSPQSWIELDGLALTGTGQQPAIPDGDFDTWITHSVDLPNGWAVRPYIVGGDIGVHRSTDHYSGNYSLELKGQILSTAQPHENGNIFGGQPYDQQGGIYDTISGYYKYFPSLSDSGSIDIGLQNIGQFTWDTSFYLPGSPSWKYFEIPFFTTKPSDTMTVDIRSSYKGNLFSTLYLDDLQLKSQVHTSGVPVESQNIGIYSFPDPATDVLNIKFAGNAHLASFDVDLYDMDGKLVLTKTCQPGHTLINLPISQLPPGMYFYSVSGNADTFRGKFVKGM